VTLERRRAPRYPVSGGELALLLSPMSVQILDISRGGVLLQSSHPARPEGTGRLTTTLKGLPFSAELEVRRVEVLPAGGYRIGAKFTTIGQEYRRVLEEFTHRGAA